MWFNEMWNNKLSTKIYKWKMNFGSHWLILTTTLYDGLSTFYIWMYSISIEQNEETKFYPQKG